jgi:hypothetical protein
MEILVTYAGSGGLAAGAAERMGKVLTGLGESVTVLPMSGVTTLTDYEAVVAGSVEHAGSWVPEAMEFVRRSQSALKGKAFAIFTVCTEMTPDKGAEARMVIMQWTAPVRSLVHPVSEGFFAVDQIRKKETQPGERSRFKLNILFGILKESDLRNQQSSIETWATKLHEKLAQSSERRA